ncbi:alpha/beta hydrolase [Paenibacillus luteus]|uniref:alpha/beta hydrolase n=1 Tax=Paenibacillus luteus TaxID=2545753 RepID=UPI00114235AF|nr:alpha/beta hydrolase [Paenibacillus luteus]
MKTTTINLTNKNVTLTTYLLDPFSNTRNRPSILILPGGGYQMLADHEAEPVAMAFLAEGYHAFILRYSIKETASFPKALNDAEEALELIRNKSSEWGIDPNKIAVCGFSAGGHLAAALGTMGEIRPNALILGYPCILESMSNILAFPVPAVNEAVNPATPPAFIFHTFEDAVVPVYNSLAFATAMDREKIPFELHIFKNGNHGLSLAKPLSSSGMRTMVNNDVSKWFDLCVAWIKNVFGEFDTNREMLIHTKIEDIIEYNLDVQIGLLWDNPVCKERIIIDLPELKDNPSELTMMGSIRVILEMGGDYISLSEEAVRKLECDLKAIPLAIKKI